MDAGCGFVLRPTSSFPIALMNPPAFLALALLVSASPLPARGSVLLIDGGSSGAFCDLADGQWAAAAGHPVLEGMSVSSVPTSAPSIVATDAEDLRSNPLDAQPGGAVPALQSNRAESPVTPEPVPEPSAVLLLIGAAAWILLRRKL